MGIEALSWRLADSDSDPDTDRPAGQVRSTAPKFASSEPIVALPGKGFCCTQFQIQLIQI
jgi:hypothetical protein